MAQPGKKRGALTRQELLADERGTIFREAENRIALVYPSPYRAAMSSLGYQTIYRQLNELEGWAACRAVLPDDVPLARSKRTRLTTLERGEPLDQYPVLAFSVAYELEIAGVVDCLELAGIPVLASDRPDTAPLVIAGGPLTFSNPAPMGPFFDLILLGEGEDLIEEFLNKARDLNFDRAALLSYFAGRPGFYVPASDGDAVPPIARADHRHVPARSAIITPHTELSSMYLTEAVRGCSRGCTYCVMRRSTNGGMRTVDPQEIADSIPEYATRVGLVGAGVTDHPKLIEIVRHVVDGGRGVGISSLRADRLSDELVGLLARGGYRTLTVASDGASERMRRIVERSTMAKHLLASAGFAKKHRLHTLKVYMMLGVPEETDEDIDELVQFSLELAKIHARIALGVAPFVAKRHTPLDGSPFAGIQLVDSRLKRLRRGLKGRATVRPVSARWAWVEYMLAQGTHQAGLACMDAHRAGGKFADYKKAFAARGCEPTGPVARVPSGAERIALHKLRVKNTTGPRTAKAT